MKFRTSLILFFLFMSAGLGGYWEVRNGYYPVALVNWDLISAKSLRDNSSVAYRYFQNVAASSGSDPGQLDTLQSQKEIRRAVIDKLISDSLILKKLEFDMKSEFQGIAENKIANFISGNKDIGQGAKLLYGLEMADFKNLVLFPQAYREILEGRLFLENEKLEDWLNKEKALARILILVPDLQWRDNEVKIRD